MRCSRYIYYLSVWLFILPGKINAQEILQRYIDTGLENNLALLRSYLDIEIAEKALEVSRAKFLPSVSLEASYSRAGGGRVIEVPAGDLINPVNEQINQLLGETRLPVDIPNRVEEFLPDNFHNTGLRIIQPVINTDVYYNFRAEKMKISIQQAKMDIWKNQLIKEIKVSYYRYLKLLEQRKIFMENRKLLNETLEFHKKLVIHGKATKNLIFDSRSQLAENNSRLAEIDSDIKRSRNYFNYILNRDMSSKILKDSLASIAIINPGELTFQKKAQEERSEIKQLKVGLELKELELDHSKAFWVPKLDLVGTAGFQGYGYTFNQHQDFWFLQIGMSWNIFSGGGHKAKVEQAQLEKSGLLNELEELRNKISLEVADARNELQEALESLHYSKTEVENAWLNYEIVNKQYRQGMILPLELKDAQALYIKALLKEVISEYTVRIRQAEFEAAAGLNIENI
ncbi:TolC family protein [Zunongwangia sp. F363]|uniref:TolC family protein n=1 Tax=Autumnicola tepida TaxID=3075595 RepID=A0ABU3CEQ1_9FLAO|nr:TolC family protein [Zunongwangia sp. F363]MDT0644824.1 TolC family protein [Zunongwangia sp. F363]